MTRNCYLDVPGFQAAQPSLSLAGLLGGNTRLTTGCAVGGTSLVVVNSGNFQPNDLVYILDGALSEVVFAASTGVTPDQTHLVLGANSAGGTGTQYAHAAMVSVSSGGAAGALGDLLLSASSLVEEYCNQGSMNDRGFYLATRTEKLEMPTSRAFLDRQYGLVLRPHWFPLVTLTSVILENGPSVATQAQFDASLAEYDTDGQVVTIPYMVPLATPTLYPWAGAVLSRQMRQWANITYTAGFAPGAMPWQFQRAVSLVAREFLAYAENPTGAAMIRQGDVQLMQRLRGSGGRESSADGLFLAQAKAMLDPYRAKFI